MIHRREAPSPDPSTGHWEENPIRAHPGRSPFHQAPASGQERKADTRTPARSAFPLTHNWHDAHTKGPGTRCRPQDIKGPPQATHNSYAVHTQPPARWIEGQPQAEENSYGVHTRIPDDFGIMPHTGRQDSFDPVTAAKRPARAHLLESRETRRGAKTGDQG